MSDIRKLLDIVSESSVGVTVSGNVATVEQSAFTQSRPSGVEPPEVLEYGFWGNSVKSTSDKLKKTRGKAKKVVKKAWGESSPIKESKQDVAEGSEPQVGDEVYYGNRLVGTFKGYSKLGKIITEPNVKEMGDEYLSKDAYWDPKDITIKPKQDVAEGSNEIDQQAHAIADKLTTGKNLEKLRGMAYDSTVYRALDRYFEKYNIPETIYNRVAKIVFQRINQQDVAEEQIDEVAGAQKCWPDHRKVGTQPGTGKNAGERVNKCKKISKKSK